MNYSVNPVRPQVSAGRILAAGWFYALSVVLFALDIAHASLFLGVAGSITLQPISIFMGGALLSLSVCALWGSIMFAT